MFKRALLLILLLVAFMQPEQPAAARTVERTALAEVGKGILQTERVGRCNQHKKHTVYLIDNFTQQVKLVPELRVSHGELVQALLESGRDDIEVVRLDTSLTRGLAQAVVAVVAGQCIDAVVSAVPGSNYTYRQVSSLLGEQGVLNQTNLLGHRRELLSLLVDIAFNELPSLEWLLKADVNPIKLREDALKITFIEALAKAGIPVYLPYGNVDSFNRGERRDINLLSVSKGARAYVGVDRKGELLPGYPSSPLTAGVGLASFDLIECPDAGDPTIAHLDVDSDGVNDFSYRRSDLIAYFDHRGNLLYAPPPVTEKQYLQLLNKIQEVPKPLQLIKNASPLVVTDRQYASLAAVCGNCLPRLDDKQLVWLNSKRYGEPYSFNPQCRKRGTINGSSLIPPLKAREQLLVADQKPYQAP